MKTRYLILALIATLGLLWGCGDDPIVDNVEQEPVLGVAIEFPNSVSTRADVGPLPALAEENAIHSLLLWVFRSDDHTLVSAPLSLTGDNLPVGGGVRRYALPVSRAFVDERPDVDIFVLANAGSIDTNLSEASSWDDLNDAFFGDSQTAPYYGFGLDHPVHTVDPQLGLPISGCGKDLHVEGEEPILSVSTVTLTRAVSRIRFVFCKTPTDLEAGQTEDQVSIQNITLESCLIPYYEYVFTTSASGIVHQSGLELQENYHPERLSMPGPSSIANNETPRDLVYANQDAVTYDALINDAVSDGRLTDMGYVYFRESDQCLRGTITYTVNNGEPITREFVMDSAGDFTRNHTWTVFGYFVSGRELQLDLRVLPWDYNVFHVDFETSSLQIDGKLTVDVNSADVVRSNNSQYDYDVRLLSYRPASCRIQVLAPVGGKLMIRPVGNASAFKLSKTTAEIHPDVDNGWIFFTVDRSEDSDPNLFQYITLSFYVETVDGRVIDANSEAINDIYRFII